jgi:hypothetical protein
MSKSSQLDEMRKDIRAGYKTVEREYHGWHYTYVERPDGLRVAIADPHKRFVTYEKMEGP